MEVSPEGKIAATLNSLSASEGSGMQELQKGSGVLKSALPHSR